MLKPHWKAEALFNYNQGGRQKVFCQYSFCQGEAGTQCPDSHFSKNRSKKEKAHPDHSCYFQELWMKMDNTS
jgi:hypothetical protein